MSLVLLLGLEPAAAQTTVPGKTLVTVYKCSRDGKVTYADKPCPESEAFDARQTPARQLPTGKEMTADAIRPIKAPSSTRLEAEPAQANPPNPATFR
jgi:hypothetical protein